MFRVLFLSLSSLVVFMLCFQIYFCIHFLFSEQKSLPKSSTSSRFLFAFHITSNTRNNHQQWTKLYRSSEEKKSFYLMKRSLLSEDFQVISLLLSSFHSKARARVALRSRFDRLSKKASSHSTQVKPTKRVY